jgi:beta-lactamase class A
MRALLTGLILLCGCASAATRDHMHEIETSSAERDRLVARIEQRVAAARAAVPDSIEDFVVAIDLLDLATNRRLSIHEDVQLHAASTMKVPVLFELFRQADAGERSVDDTIVVRNRFRSILDGSEYSLTPDDDSDATLYDRIDSVTTYRELARLMIVRSSNLATNILIERVDPRRIRETLARLNAQGMRVLRGVEDIPAYRAGLNNTTTAYGFSRVLEAIARCELLSAQSCRDITGILADQEFDEGIPAGVPEGTRVANKTGWITAIHHDGGIVYPPGRDPYVLVVLTRGIEDSDLAHALIRDLSAIVWDEVVEENGGP